MDSSKNKEIMARNITRFMERKGVTNQKLCDDLNFKYTTFMDWKKGVTYPRIGKIEAMADYFGILKSDLIEEKTEETIEMQKKNAFQVEITLRMRSDEKFMYAVSLLYQLDDEKLNSVIPLLTTLGK